MEARTAAGERQFGFRQRQEVQLLDVVEVGESIQRLLFGFGTVSI
jgi:hypothetical protein